MTEVVYVLVKVINGKQENYAYAEFPLEDELPGESFSYVVLDEGVQPLQEAVYKFDGRKKKFVLQRPKEVIVN